MPKIMYQVLQKPIEERIIDAACIYWDVEREYFTSRRPDAIKSIRRSIVYYLIRNNSSLSLHAIASKFGLSDHGRVQTLIENIEAQKNVLQHLRNDINQISHLADRLDADFITTSIQLINNKLEKSI